jgi:hypothetical protein
VAVHDFDEIGVPSGAMPSWRQRANEEWLRTILRDYPTGTVVLLGHTSLGELLATPSAIELGGISCCLLDCDSAVRRERLRDRRGWTEDETRWHESFARWLRRHAEDPQWRQEVIRHPYAPPELVWERWDKWRPGDPRWRWRVLDTSDLTVEAAVATLTLWVEAEREAFRCGLLPLAGQWWTD